MIHVPHYSTLLCALILGGLDLLVHWSIHGCMFVSCVMCTGCVSLTTRGSGGTAHTCSGRHSQYSCELLAWGPGVALHCMTASTQCLLCISDCVCLVCRAEEEADRAAGRLPDEDQEDGSGADPFKPISVSDNCTHRERQTQFTKKVKCRLNFSCQNLSLVRRTLLCTMLRCQKNNDTSILSYIAIIIV